MELISGEQLQQSRQRWQAWFDHKLDKGPLIYIEAPLDQPRQGLVKLTPPADLREKWTNIDYRVGEIHNQFASTWFGGDAVPSCFINLGPGTVAAYMGPDPTFMEDSVWFNKSQPNDLQTIHDSLACSDDNWYWQLTRDLTKGAIEAASGDYLIGLTDLGGDMDILASLRGNEGILMDLIEQPELVEACLAKIREIWMRYYRENYSLFETAGQNGHTAWMPCWSSKPWSVLQCDLSVMFSPEMFARFAMPELQAKAAALDHTIFHLDGPGEWAHLDQLLSIPELDGIQYVSLPGDPPNESIHWLDKYRRVTDAGKNVFIIVRDAEKIYELAQALPVEQLAFHIAMDSIADAQAFLARFGR